MTGKSTLAQAIAGHPAYRVTAGTIEYEGEDLLEVQPEQRARKGIFLAFQYPVAIRGITNAYFLRSALNAIRKERGLEELDAIDFLDVLEEKLEIIGWDDSMVNRPVNDGFSGGEKKRNEILQMAVLEPRLAVLDETDSGLDIDALKTVAAAVNKLHKPDNATVVVTHYQRLLNHIEPDYVHAITPYSSVFPDHQLGYGVGEIFSASRGYIVLDDVDLCSGINQNKTSRMSDSQVSIRRNE